MTGRHHRNFAVSLHHLTAMGLSPIELVQAAATTQCQHVCFFVYMPGALRTRYPMVERAMIDPLRAAMDDAHVTVFNLEVFPLIEDCDTAGMAAALVLGAELGAGHATVHVHLRDPHIARSALLRLCDTAATHGIRIGIEFNSFSAVQTAQEAATLVAACDHPNLGIIVDALHFVRSGAPIDDLSPIAPLVRYTQLCDGPATVASDARWREAIGDRARPGSGTFPLDDIARHLDHVAVFDVEVPNPAARCPGQVLDRHIIESVAAARRVLARAYGGPHQCATSS